MTSTPSSPSVYIPPASPAIPVLPTSLAQIYAVLHPAILLTLLAWRFPSLTADPVGELLSDLPLLAVLQVVFVMICLPPAGSGLSVKGETADEERKEKEKEKAPSSPSAGSAGSVVLKPGKVGYRRKTPKADSVSANFAAKLIVRPIRAAVSESRTLKNTPMDMLFGIWLMR